MLSIYVKPDLSGKTGRYGSCSVGITCHKKEGRQGRGLGEESVTYRQQKFIEEYFRTDPPGNATKAAIAADYSKHTARKQASRLLTNVDIQEKLRAREGNPGGYQGRYAEDGGQAAELRTL